MGIEILFTLLILLIALWIQYKVYNFQLIGMIKNYSNPLDAKKTIAATQDLRCEAAYSAANSCASTRGTKETLIKSVFP